MPSLFIGPVHLPPEAIETVRLRLEDRRLAFGPGWTPAMQLDNDAELAATEITHGLVELCDRHGWECFAGYAHERDCSVRIREASIVVTLLLPGSSAALVVGEDASLHNMRDTSRRLVMFDFLSRVQTYGYSSWFDPSECRITFTGTSVQGLDEIEALMTSHGQATVDLLTQLPTEAAWREKLRLAHPWPSDNDTTLYSVGFDLECSSHRPEVYRNILQNLADTCLRLAAPEGGVVGRRRSGQIVIGLGDHSDSTARRLASAVLKACEPTLFELMQPAHSAGVVPPSTIVARLLGKDFYGGSYEDVFGRGTALELISSRDPR